MAVLTRRRGETFDGLSADGTSRADTGGVFTGTGVDDGVNEDLDGVGVSEEVDDLESVGDDDADGHELLPLLRPCIMSELTRRSTMGVWALRKALVW